MVSQTASEHKIKGNTDRVRVELPLRPQDRRGDIVDEVRRAHLPTSSQIEAPTSVWVVRISNYVRYRIDDCPQIYEVLQGWRSNGYRS